MKKTSILTLLILLQLINGQTLAQTTPQGFAIKKAAGLLLRLISMNHIAEKLDTQEFIGDQFKMASDSRRLGFFPFHWNNSSDIYQDSSLTINQIMALDKSITHKNELNNQTFDFLFLTTGLIGTSCSLKNQRNEIVTPASHINLFSIENSLQPLVITDLSSHQIDECSTDQVCGPFTHTFQVFHPEALAERYHLHCQSDSEFPKLSDLFDHTTGIGIARNLGPELRKF